jgi:hypothetical protein
MNEQTTNASAISPERLAANRANAQFSTGPSAAGIAVSCLNHTIHGLARHNNGAFKLLTSEDPIGFEALKQSLADEHLAITTTESILVNAMAEFHWLAQRAQRLQDTCIDPDTGAITDEKKVILISPLLHHSHPRLSQISERPSQAPFRKKERDPWVRSAEAQRRGNAPQK